MTNRFTSMILLVLVSAAPECGGAPPTRYNADLEIIISAPSSTVTREVASHGIAIDVEEKNVSHRSVNIGRSNNEADWYQINVSREGIPANMTDSYLSISDRRYNPDLTSGFILGTLKPGKSQHWSIVLTKYYDLSQPGKYEITFTRGTNPGQPDNVDVKSNTITITVTE